MWAFFHLIDQCVYFNFQYVTSSEALFAVLCYFWSWSRLSPVPAPLLHKSLRITSLESMLHHTTTTTTTPHNHQTTTPSTSIRTRFCVAVLLISDKMLNFAHFWCFFIYHLYLICGNMQLAATPNTQIPTRNWKKKHQFQHLTPLSVTCVCKTPFVLMWHISFKMSTFPFLEWAQTRRESAATASKNRLGRIQEILLKKTIFLD